MHFCGYLHEDAHLPEQLRVALEDELYTAFHSGSDSAPHSDVEQFPLEDELPNRLNALRFTVGSITRHAQFLGQTAGNSQLAERIAHDAVQWCANIWTQAQEALPGEVDRESAEHLRAAWKSDLEAISENTDEAEPRRSLERAAQEAELRPAVAAVHALIAEQQSASPSTQRLRSIEVRAAFDALGERWTALLDGRDLSHELSFLHKALLPYVQTLNSRVPALGRYMDMVRDIFGDSRRLWDRLSGAWQEVDIGPLEHYADLLREEPSIRELARILGRGRSRQDRSAEFTERVVQKHLPYSASAGRSEIDGIRFGNDLTSLLPSEIFLLSSPDTEMVFYKRFAESELLCLAYTTENTYYHTEHRTEKVRTVREDKRGPIILCLDTSGSMAGLPERVAKALTLAVLKTAIAEGRAVYLVAFSDRIMTLELSTPDSSLEELSRFLGRSFLGGTDLRPALNQTISMLAQERFERADVLIVSDFRIPKILDRHIQRIGRQQRLGTAFYSLTVNRTGVVDQFNIFDNSWLYDISDESRRGIPLRSLTAL
ncbi:MAG TPA: VWA domain-containing protein [Spirochaetia bacterium]|nr:VWA domain-containing protein [Spirochaetia bacterium]